MVVALDWLGARDGSLSQLPALVIFVTNLLLLGWFAAPVRTGSVGASTSTDRVGEAAVASMG